MSCKLIASMVAPILFAVALVAASEAQPPPGGVVVQAGDGAVLGHAKPKPRRKIADYAWEQFIHEATGEVYLREYIRYTNGDVESRVGPDVPEFIPAEFWPQFAPAPASVISPSCNNVVQTSTLQGFAGTGQIRYDGSVQCARIGPGDTPCNTFVATFFLDVADFNGQWQPVPGGMGEVRYSSGCGYTSHPTFVIQCPTKGWNYKCDVYLRDVKTNATLDNRTIYLYYTG